jgi:hypothetical protein
VLPRIFVLDSLALDVFSLLSQLNCCVESGGEELRAHIPVFLCEEEGVRLVLAGAEK